MSTQVAGRAPHSTRPVTIVLGAAVGALALSVIAGRGTEVVAPAALVAVSLVAFSDIALRWSVLAASVVVVIFFVPFRRYELPLDLPIQLELYRLLVAAVLGLWIAALLTDRRVVLRSSVFDKPLLIFLFAAFASVAVNVGRIEALGVQAIVIKNLSFLVSFVLVYYMFVSLLRDRRQVERMVKLLVTCGAVVGAFAILESRTGINVFNHLSDVVPVLDLVGNGENPTLARTGRLRAYGPSAHPIELATLLAMLVPLAWAIWQSSRRFRWLFAGGLMTLGSLSTVSRTSVIMIVAIGVVFLWLRTGETLHLIPFAIPAVVVVFFALPNTIGTYKAAFLPQGGLIAEQRSTVQGNELGADGRLADISPSLDEYSERPIFGQGYGSRVSLRTDVVSGPARNARILDNEWLGTLLQMGLIGFGAWLWLIVRAVRRLGSLAREDPSPDGWLAVGFAASIASFAVAMLTFDAFAFGQVTFVAYIVLALAAVLLAASGRWEPRLVDSAAG